MMLTISKVPSPTSPKESGPAMPQLRERRHFDSQHPVGAGLQVGTPKGFLDLAEHQCAVDAGVLNDDGAVQLTGHFRRVVEPGPIDNAAVVVGFVDEAVLFQSVQRHDALGVAFLRGRRRADQIVEVADEYGAGVVGPAGGDRQQFRAVVARGHRRFGGLRGGGGLRRHGGRGRGRRGLRRGGRHGGGRAAAGHRQQAYDCQQ